jgi:hypothetical protein
MKRQTLMVLFAMFTLAVTGCAGNSFAAAPAETTEPGGIEDRASLIAALQTSGATVETGGPVSQPFFTPEGSIIKVNGADVQVFEYETIEAMESEASQVTSDGGSIGTTMVTWMDTPHFYKAGRIIVLYVGSDATVLDLLEGALGPQFAGR